MGVSNGALLAIGLVVFVVAAVCIAGFAYKLIARRRLDRSALMEPLVNRDATNSSAHEAHRLCGCEIVQQPSVYGGCSEPVAYAKDLVVPTATTTTLDATVAVTACGIATVTSDEARLEAAATASAHVHVDSTDDLMLTRCRRRREWTRRVDAGGRLVWHRDGGDWRFPGYAVCFLEQTPTVSTCERGVAVTKSSACESPTAEPERELEPEHAQAIAVVVHATVAADTVASAPTATAAATDTSKDMPAGTTSATAMRERLRMLVSLLRSTRLDVTDASVADARLLSLARASDLALQWREALAMSAEPFSVKRAHFVAAAAVLVAAAERASGPLELRVRRTTLLSDLLEALSALPTASARTPVRVQFVGEMGEEDEADAATQHSKWIALLTDALADVTSAGVFTCVDASAQTFYLNAHSHAALGDQHLLHCFAAGRVVGRALLEGQTLGFHLALPLRKLVLGIPVTFSDLAHFDPELHADLTRILDTDGVDALGRSFSVTEQQQQQPLPPQRPRHDSSSNSLSERSRSSSSSGAAVVVDLVPGGHSIDLTDDNKDEYLDRRLRYALFESVSSQLAVFLDGFYEVVPHELLVLFDADELDYLLCGSDEIDVDDWEKHTKYTESLYEHSAMIWFWEIVCEMPNEHCRRLLRFATGSSRVPIAGFSALTSYDGRLCPFTLHGVPLQDGGSVTCDSRVNRLELPLYTSREQLCAAMNIAAGIYDPRNSASL